MRGGNSVPAGGALRRHLALCTATNDIGLDHHVSRAADHNEMFDIVAANENQPSAPVDGSGVDHGKSRHPAPVGGRAHAIGRKFAD